MPIPAWLQTIQNGNYTTLPSYIDWDGSQKTNPMGGYLDASSNRLYTPHYASGLPMTPEWAESIGLPQDGYTAVDLNPIRDANGNIVNYSQIDNGGAYWYDKDGNEVSRASYGPGHTALGEYLAMAIIAAAAGGAASGAMGAGAEAAGAGAGAGGAETAGAAGAAGTGGAGASSGMTMLPGGGAQFGVLDATVPWGAASGGAAGSTAGAAGIASGGGSSGGGGLLGGLETASGANSIANMLPSGAGTSGLGSLMGGARSYLGPASTVLGALSGSQGQDQSQSSERRTDPRFDPYIFGANGQPGILGRMQALLAQQSTPEFQRAYDQQRNIGLGLLNTPVTTGRGLAARWAR